MLKLKVFLANLSLVSGLFCGVDEKVFAAIECIEKDLEKVRTGLLKTANDGDKRFFDELTKQFVTLSSDLTGYKESCSQIIDKLIKG